MKNSGMDTLRKRILIVSKSTGGLATYMRWLAAGLDSSRFDLTFICLSEGGQELADELSKLPGVHAVHWKMERFKINLFTDAQVIVRLARYIREHHFDLIHAHAAKAGFITRMAAINSGVPVIYSPHGFSFAKNRHSVLNWLYASIERFAARFLTTRVITVSNYEKVLAEKYRIGHPDLCVAVHSGIDLKELDVQADGALRKALNIPREVPLIGTVGRLNPQKAPLDFVRLAGLLRESMPDAHFVWIGDGDMLEAAVGLGRQIGLNGSMHFPGARTDVHAVLQELNCFVLTSHWEAFPLALLEAMAVGLPVVATRLPGVEESVEENVSGYLHPVGDLGAMRDSVQRIVSDRALAKNLGTNGRRRVEESFTRQRMISEIEQVYWQALSGNG